MEKINKKISVIIPAYNYAQYLNETVMSVLNQTYKNLECIIVDDGSTDNTKNIISNLQKSDDRLIYIYQENQGLSAARNKGMKISSGDYIAFLDADDLWLKEKLENQIKKLFSHNADVVFSDFDYLKNNEIINNNEKDDSDNLDIYDFIKKCPIRGSASSIMFKKSVFKEVGFFDTSLRAVEDLDYWFRIALSGFNFTFFNKKDVIIRQHMESMSKGYEKMFFFQIYTLEKQIYLLKKKYPKIDPKRFKKAILYRTGLIRWYAHRLKRKDYVFVVHLLGIHYLKIKYINRLTARQLFQDLFKKYNH